MKLLVSLIQNNNNSRVTEQNEQKNRVEPIYHVQDPYRALTVTGNTMDINS